jgi:hypothetical protein
MTFLEAALVASIKKRGGEMIHGEFGSILFALSGSHLEWREAGAWMRDRDDTLTMLRDA